MTSKYKKFKSIFFGFILRKKDSMNICPKIFYFQNRVLRLRKNMKLSKK